MIPGSGIALVARMISVTQISDVVHRSPIAIMEMSTRDMQIESCMAFTPLMLARFALM